MMKSKMLRVPLKNWERSMVKPEGEQAAIRRKRASMKANAVRAFKAKVRRAEESLSESYRAALNRYFANFYGEG